MQILPVLLNYVVELVKYSDMPKTDIKALLIFTPIPNLFMQNIILYLWWVIIYLLQCLSGVHCC